MSSGNRSAGDSELAARSNFHHRSHFNANTASSSSKRFRNPFIAAGTNIPQCQYIQYRAQPKQFARSISFDVTGGSACAELAE